MDITRLPLFSGLSPEDVEALQPALQKRKMTVGTRIFDEGDPVRGFYVVLSGSVKIFKTSPRGTEQVLAVILPGQTFAEAAVFMGGGYPASTECLDDCELLFVEREPFVRRLHADPDLALRMMAGMALKLRRMVAMVEDLTLRDARGRICRYLLGLLPEGATAPVELELPAQQLLIARMLGVTAETLSRTLKTLREDGALETLGGGKFLLLDLEELRHSAGEVVAA
ncbi:Crp/Fnr family transcriptional regulator [bacterium CPR1]|nr:Crp/Fnr family transcriptional regulator [bacterium CPR1]